MDRVKIWIVYVTYLFVQKISRITVSVGDV